jgi:hypothetical protein
MITFTVVAMRDHRRLGGQVLQIRDGCHPVPIVPALQQQLPPRAPFVVDSWKVPPCKRVALAVPK